MTTTTEFVPADKAFARDDSVRNYSVQVDANADRGVRHFDLLSFDRVAGTGFARSMTTGLVYRVVRTGRKVARNGMVRVALFAAEDTGRLDGALSFPARTMGGFVNVAFL
jgi:hypothetical protein